MKALLNPRVWLAIAIAATLAFTHFFVYRAGKATVRTEFDAYKLAQSEQRILADRAQRTEETRRQAAVDQEVKNAQPAIAAEARDAAALPDSRLQQPAIRYIRRACPNPTPAAPGAPAGDPIMVFADVLGRIEQRSEDLARLAGERGTAGALCERYADGLQPTDRQ